jgi:hypothetical protein
LKGPKPPVAVRVKSLDDFTRLALALTDSPPLLWQFKYEKKYILSAFTVYMSWKGDIPLLAYIPLRKKPSSFLAYRSNGEGEECLFTDNIEDTRYVYAPIIKLREAPQFFKASLQGKFPHPPQPLGVELDSLYSLMRLLYLVSSKEYMAFPIWHFRRHGRRILGVCIPFEHYYESNALPVFFYIRVGRASHEPFLRYLTSRSGGESISYSRSTGDPKFFYAKIIDVEDMPLFPG